MDVWDQNNKRQTVLGRFKLTVDLPHDYKGTHMSRFVEALEQHRGEMSLEIMPELVDNLRNRLDAERAHVRVDFPYFIRKRAPVSKAESSMRVDCWFVGDAEERDAQFTLGVSVPVLTLCPCSKAISRAARTASAERADVDPLPGACVDRGVRERRRGLRVGADLPAPEAGGREVDHGDVVRQPALRRGPRARGRASLADDERILWFDVEVENEESIHTHNAFAAA